MYLCQFVLLAFGSGTRWLCFQLSPGGCGFCPFLFLGLGGTKGWGILLAGFWPKQGEFVEPRWYGDSGAGVGVGFFCTVLLVPEEDVGGGIRVCSWV